MLSEDEKKYTVLIYKCPKCDYLCNITKEINEHKNKCAEMKPV